MSVGTHNGEGRGGDVPDASETPDALGNAAFDLQDWELGGEAAVPPRDFGPPISSQLPTPHLVANEIRELERRLRSRLTPLLPFVPARRLPLEFLWTRYRRLAMRGRSEAVDDYGRDPLLVSRLTPILDFLFDRYFRVEVTGLENVPERGAAILVANHSGALPYDIVFLMHALRNHRAGKRPLRPLIEDFLFHAPYVGLFLARLGAVRACPQNAARLLDAGDLVAVFPEGEKGPGKLYKERYRLQRFGRGGFVKLALRQRCPVIPVAIIGAEETHPVLGKVTRLARGAGLSHLPMTPTFPWLGPLGLLPVPTKWHIHFGAPIDLDAEADAANDRQRVVELTGEIRDRIQAMIDERLARRDSVILG